MSLFDRFKRSLAKTRAAIVARFVSPQWSAEEMERALIAADFGPRLASELAAGVRRRLELNPRATAEEAIAAAKIEIESIFGADGAAASVLFDAPASPWVLLMVGVNGTGKTTTIAKLAKRLRDRGDKVLLAAGDTFRAAAIDQLKSWGQRLNVDVVSGNYGADPGSVAHDAVKRAQAGGYRRLMVDTAGRQHTKSNLMQELQKVRRVISKAHPGAPHETWLVVDAPTGGNALVQAREFHSALALTGVIVTKLDGTAKGGVVAGIRKEIGLPIRFVGLGEAAEDLEPFDPKAFAEALWNS
ncbi:MAG: signal recognition particle-docking protein FtsY [Verrucomicrobia bacterium]|nr:signal recognition particle-docking protein FtsY [Verrucomicrobiota bacterium]